MDGIHTENSGSPISQHRELVAGMSRVTLDDDTARRGDWLLSELSETQRGQLISDRAIAFISSEVGNLPEIGKIMGFSADRLTQYQGSYPHCVKTQVSSMLSDWRIKMSTRATVEKFVRLLREANIDDGYVRTVMKKELAIHK
ncbi:hypothetical protein LSAT2_012096 [Lamellibrachia satsuma]|nr:hypothetical protein LSAT2_012096 [Lamellibrachia satsuma]